MKSKILLLAFSVAALSSCTTAYKTGQTPDDVYYSPTRPLDEYAKTEKEDDNQYRNNEVEYYEDHYLRMKVRNRYRWSDLDDPYYYSRRYNYSAYNCCCFGNPWTPYTYWNSYYNPYYHNSIIVNPKSLTYTRPRTFNLNAYNNNALTNSNYSNPKYRSSGNGTNNNNNTYTAPRNRTSNNESNSGNILRNVFKSNGNSNSSSGSSNNNSSSSSSSGSSGSSSSGSTNAPVRRF